MKQSDFGESEDETRNVSNTTEKDCDSKNTEKSNEEIIVITVCDEVSFVDYFCLYIKCPGLVHYLL